MKLQSRLMRLTLVSLALVGTAFVLAFAALVVIVGSAVAFSASTGGVWQHFLDRLAPMAYFAAGAYVAGGLIAIVNALATPQGIWVKSVVVGSIGGGLVTLLNPPLARLLLAMSNPVLSLLGKALLNK
jgi:hypothetical protein